MNRLCFDLGNTRIKWWCGQESGVIPYETLEDPLTALLKSRNGPVEVVFASVIQGERRTRFLSVVANFPGARIFECVVTAQALGVECGYTDIGKLGIDRWLAVIAAWALYKQPVLVVDAGTATTLDFLAADGQHLGGYIIPGLRLSIGALLSGTSRVIVDSDKVRTATRDPGKNTNDAVYNGAAATIASVIERTCELFRQEYMNAKLLLTGGDAELIAAWLHCEADVRPDLLVLAMELLHSNGLAKEIINWKPA